MQDLYQRPRSPFDDSALERLRRMGLVTAKDTPDRDVMNVFSGIFAGQFYDDLCDYYCRFLRHPYWLPVSFRRVLGISKRYYVGLWRRTFWRRGPGHS